MDEKKPFQIKIAGFTFGKTQIIVIAVIVGLILLASAMNKYKDQKEYERRLAEAEAASNNSVEYYEPEPYDYEAEIQKSLTEQYGQAPEGFKWNYMGELVATGDDESATCEDVVYMFLRSLSVLDFSTASRYSTNSRVIDSYKDYYDSISNVITDYYDNFLRKQYKESIASIEVESIGSRAVFSDGTEYITITLSALDLQNKDFWRGIETDLWSELRIYKETELDSTKVEQTVYNYLLDRYADGSVGKRTYTIELVVSKINGGGWLVSGDNELNAVLTYENGVDVARYILDAFNDWYMSTTMEEQMQQINNRFIDLGE